MSVVTDVTDTISALRREVCALHEQLTRYQLVVWTAGNVSARVPGHDLMVIKPSGVSYDDLTPDNMVVCDLDGNVVEGDHAPSSDTAAQALVYREMPHVGGVVHTHSTYACAWAARGAATRLRGARRACPRDPRPALLPDCSPAPETEDGSAAPEPRSRSRPSAMRTPCVGRWGVRGEPAPRT